MKFFSFFAVAVLFLTAGCVTNDKLVMERTVPVSQYTETVKEMVKEIEALNRYEANDVLETICGDRVTIRVIAERMTNMRCYEKNAVRLQNENLALKKRVNELEEQVAKHKLVPVNVSTNGSVTVDLRNVRTKCISVK